MCVGFKDMLSIMISPASAIRTGARAMGYDSTTSTLLGGDFIGHMLNSKKEDREDKKAAQKEQEAWNRYYASMNSSASSPFTTYSGGNK